MKWLIFLVAVPVSFWACKKEEPAQALPVESFLTYTMASYGVRALPLGGFAVRCNGQAGYGYDAQMLSAEGELLERIGASNLPLMVEGVLFDTFAVSMTDFVQWSSNHYVLMCHGWVADGGPTLEQYLLVYQVNAQGHEIAPPLCRHLVTSEGFVSIHPHGFKSPQGDLIVGANYPDEDSDDGECVVFRLPMSGSGSEESSIFFDTDGFDPGFGLVSLQTPDSRHFVLTNTPNGSPCVRELSVDATSIYQSSVGILTLDGAQISFLADYNGQVVVGGDVPNSYFGRSLFTATFSSLTTGQLNDNVQVISLPEEIPYATYAASGVAWNGNIAVITNRFDVNLADPSSYTNTQSDLGLFLVSPENGQVLHQETIVAGEGLLGLWLFNDNHHLVCLGRKKGYENVGVNHTFFMKLKDPE